VLQPATPSVVRRSTCGGRLGSAAVALAALLIVASPAGAQYFGRNKVQYDRFEFRVLETPHFDIHYYAGERDAVLQAARMAERWYDRLSAALDHKFDRRQPIILYASHGHFAQTTITPAFLSDGIGGLTDHQAGRVVLPFAAGLAETDHVLGHELVHAFQRDILHKNGSALSLMPLWFAEGMAEYLSVGRIDPNTAMWLRDAVNGGRLPRLENLNDPRWFPYRYGQALWAYLGDTYGEAIAARALKAHVKGGAIARLAAVTNTKADDLSAGWRDAMKKLAAETTRAEMTRVDRAIVSSAHDGGRLNVGPALNPDGTRMVFLSERDGYAVDVFLADVQRGTIVRKLLSTATDPHFDSIQFIESAGAWDRDGKRFALATVRDGTAMLTIFDMPEGTASRQIPVGAVDEIFTPTWSPDGSEIAFSGIHGGATDLYVLTLATGIVRPLTTDLFADLQPAWSPDGRRIAFVTDRFTSSLESLTFGGYRLAALDVDSGVVTSLPFIEGAKNIDPHWAPDGQAIYFIADHNGVSNIYRLDLTDADVAQMTNVQTGVSGITALSPTMSVASRAGSIAYSVYRDGTYEIRALGAGESPTRAHLEVAPIHLVPSTLQMAALAVDRPFAVTDRDRLPAESKHDAIAAREGGIDSGPLEHAYLEKAYARRLSLFSLGQPYLSAGGGAFGSFVRAGAWFSLGDLLGEQQLETAIQVGRTAMDFAVQSVYLNRRSRWTWGLLGGQIPVMTGISQTARRTSDTGDLSVVREALIAEQIHRQSSVLVMYPFNRSRRIEFSVGADAIGFRTEALTSVFSGVTGRLVDQSREARPGPRPVAVMQGGATFVSDTSVHGPTSPVLGERYRFGVTPTFGTLRLATLVADYRKYVMPFRPFTIAMRVQHVGRYGPDANDPRLLPFVWYVQDTVRGFDGRVLPGPDCSRAPSSTCEGIDAATTRRLVAANVEVRFPLFGLLNRSIRYGGVIPIEGLLFTDAGAFWTRDMTTSGVRTVLRSAGAGVRVNAGGFVFEFDGARPIDSVAQGWRLSFNFRPGF
jgi:surface antigen Omp85-like protein/WD40 repeat protein